MFNKILVPVDMSSPEPGAKSCAQARQMQEAWGAEVKLLSVVPGYSMPLVSTFFPEDAMEKMQATVLADLQKVAGKYFDNVPECEVISGKRSQEILRFADEWKPDLIVFGCRPKDMVGGELMLGSVGLSVSEKAKCNVLIAR